MQLFIIYLKEVHKQLTHTNTYKSDGVDTTSNHIDSLAIPCQPGEAIDIAFP